MVNSQLVKCIHRYTYVRICIRKSRLIYVYIFTDIYSTLYIDTPKFYCVTKPSENIFTHSLKKLPTFWFLNVQIFFLDQVVRIFNKAKGIKFEKFISCRWCLVLNLFSTFHFRRQFFQTLITLRRFGTESHQRNYNV